jgi:hypothetical protein
MKVKVSSFDLGSISMTILGLCLVFAQASFAAEGPALATAKPLIQLKKYDLRNSADLSDLKLQHIQVQQKMGPGSGSGGDSCALMILANTKALLSKINDEAIFGNSTEIPKRLEDAIKNSEILFAPELDVEGSTVEVINYPHEKQLLISERFCQRINEVSVRSMGLLLHEYLGLAETEDRKFEISSGFVNELNKSDYDPRIIEGSEPLKLMKGQYLEVQRNIPFHANVPNVFVFKPLPTETFRGGLISNGARDYDRILPKGTRIKILNVETTSPRFLTGEKQNCLNSFTLNFDHPAVTEVNIFHYFHVRNENECYRKGETVRVEDFYKSVGEYFVIKAQAPRPMN